MNNQVIEKSNVVSKINLLKFILGSGFGAIMFLVPIPQGESFTTCLGLVIDTLKSSFSGALPYAVVVALTISAIVSTVDYFYKPSVIQNNQLLKAVFSSSPLYLISKIVGAIISIMVIAKVGPEAIISGATGGTMLDLSATLIVIAVSLSYILPFLTDCGVMEFMGVLLKPVVRKLFTVPGRASVDLISSWFGASNSAVILTKSQYDKGYYTGREAAVIMTNFSIVSIPFCLIIAGVIGVEHLFPAFYFTICIVGFLLAVIIPRIPPLSKLPNTFNEKTGKSINEEVPEGYSTMEWALEQSCDKAEKFNLKCVTKSGNEVLFGMLFNLIPIVVAWGTVGLIIVEFTPIFQWIAYPMGHFLNILGVEHAFQVAPATLVGFADMFIPALLVAGVESVKTKFIIGVLSLVQIIYMTEVGVIIIQSDVPLDLKKIFIIFLERTIIALPIIVVIANFIIR